MRIFITGASGYIGSHLLKRLETEGHQIHALMRSPQKNAHLASKQTTLFKGDILSKKAIHKAMKGCQQVYHLAACTSIWEKKPQVYYDNNVVGTNNLLDIALKLDIEKTLITSSAGVFGPSLGYITDENTPRRIDYFNEYEASKAISESFIKTYIIRHNMNVVIVNPTRVYGPYLYGESGSVTLMIERYCKGTWKFLPGDGSKIGNYVYIDDVVKGHVKAMENGRKGENYLLGGVNCSYNELFENVQEAMGKRYRLFSTPIKLQLVYGYLQLLRTLLTGKKPIIIPKWIKRGNYDWKVSTNKLNKELGIKTTPLKVGIAKTVAWCESK